MATRLFDLAVSKSAPIYHLRPDPLLLSPDAALGLHAYEPPPEINDGPIAIKEGDTIPPSMLRRSRFVRNGAAFTFTSPLPVEFPYDLRHVESGKGESEEQNAMHIEKKLALLEPDLRDVVTSGKGVDGLSSKERTKKLPKATLLSLSEACRKAWLPQLDVGKPGDATRAELVEALAGRTVLAKPGSSTSDSEQRGFFPWSLCYGGHQFGQWAGQLGDGRAVSIFSTPSDPESTVPGPTVELQLKGAGRTPYSRFADGLAVLRSSIREYLGAEAVYALGVPTSRALALVEIESVKVRREKLETAAIVTRVANSWIRIGNFEIQADRQEWDSLRLLVRYAADHVLHVRGGAQSRPEGQSSRSLAYAVVKESARRNALMVAGWQAYGFCHGVINSDNVQLAGLTIDYGPYAFMDRFDFHHICNHSDDFGRYSYANQPDMVLFGVEKLAGSLAEMMAAEDELAERQQGAELVGVEANWASDKETMERWREAGLKRFESVREYFKQTYEAEYLRLMKRRFGLVSEDARDKDLIDNYLCFLNDYELDFTDSFRLLSQHPGVDSKDRFDAFLKLLIPAATANRSNAVDAATAWFKSFDERCATEGRPREEQKKMLDQVNPRFTLRQWVLEEIIEKTSSSDAETKRQGVQELDTVLEMSLNPFEAYGESSLDAPDGQACPTPEERERQRLCDVGPASLLGFQCSCSS